MMDSETITRNLVEAANIFNNRWQHARLIFRREEVYRVNLINHLGEIIDSGVDTRKAHCDIEIMCDGDIYQAMINPQKTMREYFDETKEKIAGMLFDMSLTQTVVNVEWSVVGDRAGVTVYFGESMDGQTNITAEVIEAVLDLLETKYDRWNDVIDNM